MSGSETDIIYYRSRYITISFLPKGAQKAKNTSPSETKSAKVEADKVENTNNLSRQQWKNKMKNKRKCKNKFLPDKPEKEVNKTDSEDKQGPKQEVKMASCKNNSEKVSRTAVQKKNNERKQQKKKTTKDDPDAQTRTQGDEKQLIDNEKKRNGDHIKIAVTQNSVDGAKQKSGEPKRGITDNQQQVKRQKPELSKEQSQKRDKLRKMLQGQKTDQRESPVMQKDAAPAPKEVVEQDRSASLRSRMEQRLESARFRYINEVLYSTTSAEAKCMFKHDPDAFWIYHRGYTAQVQRWPANPVDAVISYIRQK